MTTDYMWRCSYRGCAVRFRFGPERFCPLHADQDSEDTLLKRMAAFTALSAIPGEHEANDKEASETTWTRPPRNC